jgi:hypothetical protein
MVGLSACEVWAGLPESVVFLISQILGWFNRAGLAKGGEQQIPQRLSAASE